MFTTLVGGLALVFWNLQGCNEVQISKGFILTLDFYMDLKHIQTS